MAYFNHAFKKTFLATGNDITITATNPAGASLGPATATGGFLDTASSGLPTIVVNQLAAAATISQGNYSNNYVGLFTKDMVSVDTGDLTKCCPLYLVGSAIYCEDKISPFLGGYQETNKSKLINPRYVSRFYGVDSCPPTNNVVHVGSTYASAGGGVLTLDALSLVGGTGYTNGTSTTTVTGGTGTGLIVEITVALGVVTAVTVLSPGKDYTIGDTVTIDGGNNDATIDILTVTTAIAPVIPGTDCCKEFLCGETYNLRLDVKGSPALRFLNHNAYYTATAYTGCCPA